MRVARYPYTAVAAAGATVILNAAYATDTLLDGLGDPITDLDLLDSWAPATGPTFNFTNAYAAGATQRPVYVAASGVSGGAQAALTSATTVTIPAGQDCLIYVKANLGVTPRLYPLGLSSSADVRVGVAGDGDATVDVSVGATLSVSLYYDTHSAGVYLYRFRRSGSSWYIARTGDAEQSATVIGTATAAISFDTLLGYRNGSGLDVFSASGDYLQKLKISYGSASPDTAYELANGGLL